MEQRFRQFVLTAAALAIGVELVMWFYVPEDSIVLDLWTLDGYGSLVEPSMAIYVLLLVAKFLIFFGLYIFSPAARPAFLFYLAFIVLASVAWGWRVTPPLVSPIGALELIISGVILGQAFYGPVARKFEKVER